MKKLILLLTAIALMPLLSSCSSTGSSVRVSYGVGIGVGHYRYGYRPWYPCRFGCRPPIVERPRPELPYEPTPELPYEPPIFEATPLPEMDFDMDYGVW